jgi:hypothetical protein
VRDLSRSDLSGQLPPSSSLAARLERQHLAVEGAVALLESGRTAAGVNALRRLLPELVGSVRIARLHEGLRAVRGLS